MHAVVCRHLLSVGVVVCNAAGMLAAGRVGTLPSVGPAGRWVRGRSARWRPGTWAVWWPTLHGGPVQLRPVRATPCYVTYDMYISGLSVCPIQALWL